ncbi:DUF1488 domain-containing protein [Vibrio sp. AK197]
MNQSILFPDIQRWDEANKQVVFPAQQGGALIECYVSGDELEKISGYTIKTGEQALAVFEDCRFELEELAEQLIEDELYSDDGKIVIGC